METRRKQVQSQMVSKIAGNYERQFKLKGQDGLMCSYVGGSNYDEGSLSPVPSLVGVEGVAVADIEDMVDGWYSLGRCW